jgi:hypothetical protein
VMQMHSVPWRSFTTEDTECTHLPEQVLPDLIPNESAHFIVDTGGRS